MKAQLLFGFMITFSVCFAQRSALPVQGGAFVHNPTAVACLTDSDYAFYLAAVAQNKAQLDAQGKRLYDATKNNQQVDFLWPVQQAEGFDYNNIWSISNYVDHNPATGQLADWNCGTRTYDTASGYDHRGVDIFTWPFTWKMVDEEQGEVIAAAAGQIVFKNDGSYDRNCSFNSDQWNAVFVEHSDGSVAWYGHLKNGSLTSKNVGDTVEAGEFLGVIASSGNSTGPHLHFEVFDADDQLIDPYIGPCNNLNTETWWADPKPYVNPGINAVLTHTDIPDFGSCPDTETTFESNQVDANGSLYFAGYFRDQQVGETATFTIKTPSGAIHDTWTRTFDNFFYASWWLWQRTVSEEEGMWSFEVSYRDEVVAHNFNVGELSITDVNALSLEAFPNPASNQITITANTLLDQIIFYDVQGRAVQATQANSAEKQVDISSLASGVYFVAISAQEGQLQQVLRIVKK